MMALARELASRNQRLGAAYLDTLATLDQDAFARNLKFELALSHVKAHAEGLIEPALKVLYAGRDPNANHVAIGELHKVGWASWTLTTNFDDALERTGAFQGYGVRIPLSQKNVTKLHGDGRTGDGLVATLEAMTTTRALNLSKGVFSALVALGVRRIFTVGYSGTGDLDIVPALQQAHGEGVEIWWSVRDKRTVPPLAVAGVVVTNLEDPSATGNVLLALTSANAETPPVRRRVAETVADVQQKLTSLVRELDLAALIRIPIALLLEAGLGWQAAKLLTAVDLFEPRFENREQLSLACERISAYAEAERCLALSEPANAMQKSSWLARRAFLIQESGDIESSRALYKRALGILNDIGTADFRTADFVRRGYLESNIDVCARHWTLSARKATADRFDLQRQCHALQEAAWHEDPMVAEVLALRSAQIDYLLSTSSEERKSAARKASEALGEAVRLQHAEGEAAASRFLIRAFGWSGLRLVWARRRETERPTRVPARDQLKLVPSVVVGLLPHFFLPWKLQPPMGLLVKRTVNRISEIRLRRRRIAWRRLLLNG